MDLETYPGWGTLPWYDAQMEAGDGVLSVCFKGQLFFADVLTDGRLRAASADGRERSRPWRDRPAARCPDAA